MAEAADTVAADTIAAVASAPGIGGVGVLRVSGPRADVIARRLLGRKPRPRHAHYAAFRDGADDLIDRGLLLWFPAPGSYTGEHVVELQTHGSPIVLQRLLRCVIALGARAARPGEFSERAFLNGKLDLVQAEAVADLIASGSDAAARAAQRSLEGEFSRRVNALTAAVIALRTHIEAALDFPDEDIDALAAPVLRRDLDALATELDDVLAAARNGVRLADGLHVVIAGAPNVGKSSLLNALAQSDRAIVADIAGTTRDVLRETIDLDGIAITLVDTAGLRDSDDIVEREGVRRARAELARADLVLMLREADADAAANTTVPDSAPTAEQIVVHSKIDRASVEPRSETRAGVTHVWLSAQSGAGLALLIDELRRRAGQGENTAGAFSARARHVVALERARLHVDEARTMIAANAGELAAEELRVVQRALGEITGEFSSDNLLGAIFGTFCIGK